MQQYASDKHTHTHQDLPAYLPVCPPTCPPQADRKALLRLLTKAPALLKLRAAHIQPVLDFLCSAGGGLERRAMLPVFLAWPVLATTSGALLRQRCAQMPQSADSKSALLQRLWLSVKSSNKHPPAMEKNPHLHPHNNHTFTGMMQ